jgi:hypothetical protein
VPLKASPALLALLKARCATKRPKYGNTKVRLDGLAFDSKLEARRYQELSILQKSGEIRDLRTQVSYTIVVNGEKICRYVADFVYEKRRPVAVLWGTDWQWTTVVEDCKSEATKTATYRLKKKLMKAVHGIAIVEVERLPSWKKLS